MLLARRSYALLLLLLLLDAIFRTDLRKHVAPVSFEEGTLVGAG